MRARQLKVLDLLGEEGVRFRIPLFQRSYAWDRSQCQDLAADLLRAAREGKPHFASTVLYVPAEREAGLGSCSRGNQPAVRVLDVVDGQQRLVTLSLILLALCERLEEREERLPGLGPHDLRATFLQQGEGCKMDLSLVDRATLQALVEGRPLPTRPSARVVDSFAYFRDLMGEPDFDPDSWWRGLRSLFCIAVELDERDHPQAVFESLNAKGAGLVTADMVRNFLLFGRSHGEQRRLYEDYWEPMQALFGDDPGSLRMNNAILGWLSVRSPKNRAHRDKQAFRVFRQYFEQQYQGSVEELLKELYSFCMVWAENYRYHAVKAFRSADWASIGKKTLVSDRPKKPVGEETARYYADHFGVNVDRQW
ncbi:MAG: DUF262 domain-containing protein [Eggerthellaceae bacterium]